MERATPPPPPASFSDYRRTISVLGQPLGFPDPAGPNNQRLFWTPSTVLKALSDNPPLPLLALPFPGVVPGHGGMPPRLSSQASKLERFNHDSALQRRAPQGWVKSQGRFAPKPLGGPKKSRAQMRCAGNVAAMRLPMVSVRSRSHRLLWNTSEPAMFPHVAAIQKIGSLQPRCCHEIAVQILSWK